MDLVILWAGIIAFIIVMYVILDGFDLGIGILFPFAKDEQERSLMMNSIAPVWDGNETWLVLGGATLYATFPRAYGLLLPILYMPVMLMIIALLFRGIAFEFRFKAKTSIYLWNAAFHLGSIFATFMQGIILGTFVRGFDSMHLSGNVSRLHWLTPYSVLTGISLIFGYALLGATWMIIKSQGELQNTMYRKAKYALSLVSVALLMVSVWTPFTDPAVITRWFVWPNILYLSPLPLLTAIAVMFNFVAIQKRMEKLPFILSICLFVFAYIGLIISIYPYIIPHIVTIWQAASPRRTQLFVLAGVGIMLPVLIAYTAYTYRVFRGKVSLEDGY